MKRIFFFILVLAATSSMSNAQQRSIARGAEEGELYMAIGWYVNYYESQYAAILHITENGKKAEMNYSMRTQEPNAGIADSLPMQAYFIMADATPGIVYAVDWYMTYEASENNRLWFSDDYGKTWELRNDPGGQKIYLAANAEGLIYRAGWDGTYKSTDYAETFVLINDKKLSFKEPDLKECDFFALSVRNLYHTYDCFENYINITIEPEYIPDFDNASP
ncbi:MAG: hypothetical protein LBD23_03795 [Oscillospiraceae bacterium]|jgi:hypothetical protein|nr:hypothetical protein [Oscillospiraceae bacterium]